MTASGTGLATAGEKLASWALTRLAVNAARSERRYPILGLILAILAWVPVYLLYMLFAEIL